MVGTKSRHDKAPRPVKDEGQVFGIRTVSSHVRYWLHVTRFVTLIEAEYSPSCPPRIMVLYRPRLLQLH